MTLDINPHWAIGVLLLSCRLGAALLATPLLGPSVPAQARVLLVLTLSACLVSASGKVYAGPLTLGAVGLGVLSEVLIGGVLAFGVLAAFGAFAVAGKLLDVQTGFALASVFDPATRARTPILAAGLSMLAVVVFFAINGHHALLRGLALSLDQLPLGTWPSLAPEPLVRQFGVMLSLGVALIAPAFLGLFLIELATAVISRVLPQANVLVVMMPLKIVAGLALLAASLPLLSSAMVRIYASIFSYWQEVLAHG